MRGPDFKFQDSDKSAARAWIRENTPAWAAWVGSGWLLERERSYESLVGQGVTLVVGPAGPAEQVPRAG